MYVLAFTIESHNVTIIVELFPCAMKLQSDIDSREGMANEMHVLEIKITTMSR